MNLKETYNKIAEDWYREVSGHDWWEPGLYTFISLFHENESILDVGCGEGIDSYIFVTEFGLKTIGTDIYKDKKIEEYKIDFKKGSIYKLPFLSSQFDYVYTHDVLHHIDCVI